MSERLFLCTDLDRTLIPNGPQPESPEARRRFRQLCESQRLTLAYVSGRHRSLVKKAIVNYALPQPDYVVGDVGTTIYRIANADDWHHLAEWEAHIGEDWAGRSHGEISRLFSDLTPLRLQEKSKQNRYKLSYYISLHSDRGEVDRVMRERLREAGVNATLVWSVDEPAGVGLLDVLPARATKLHAVEFLRAAANDNQASLYLARGGFMQMNGNYSAGILEGAAHYHPQLVQTILAAAGEQGGVDG
ncbi:MAG: HAD family hydrolase [Candidatus Thiodiazotropha sp.]